jgi:lipopolysaccharide export system protein LptA
MASQQTYRASRIRHHASYLIFVALVLYQHSCACLRAQQVEGTNFKVADLFEPPHERQIRSLIEGARWRHEGAQTAVYDAKVQTYATNGAVQLIIEAPECFYDEPGKAINSAGPVKFRTADGRFVLSGVGFTWLQTNSILYISNQVQTVVLSDFVEPGSVTAPTNSAAQSKAVTVFSDRFEYSRKSGIGVYDGHVRAFGSNVNFKATSDVMEVFVPEREHQLRTITMKEKVALDYETVEATGDTALYTAATGIAKVTGSPAWHDSEGRQGRGNELTIDRTNKTFLADGQAWLRMPAQNMAGPNGLFSSATNSTARTNQFVEIFSDHYQFETNALGKLAQFGEHVLMIDRDNSQTNGTLTAATMQVTLIGTNQLQSMVAEKNVVIQNNENQFTGQKAVYTATNGILELTGSPSPTWRAGTRNGSGDVILVGLKEGKMDVVTNAYMRLPADELGPPTGFAQGTREQSLTKADYGKTETSSAPSKERVEGNFTPLPPVPEEHPKRTSSKSDPRPQAPPEFAEIFSERYTMITNAGHFEAHFDGGVRIVHPRLDWVCQTMDVNSPDPAKKDVTMVAQREVEFSFKFDSENQKTENVHGACERAVYNYAVTPSSTNDTMTLTGNPILQTTNATITNKIIILDCANNKLMAPGKFRIYGTNSALIRTNSFHFSGPKKKK